MARHSIGLDIAVDAHSAKTDTFRTFLLFILCMYCLYVLLFFICIVINVMLYKCILCRL